MTIKGLSESRRMPRIGKLRLGVKAESGKTGNLYPKAVDYFVCNEDKSTTAEAAAAFHLVYGEQPKNIEIMFPNDDTEVIFPQFYRCYGSSGLLCKGDGERAGRVDKETGELIDIICPAAECEFYQKKTCRHIGTLLFMLPSVPGFGVWQIDTTSYNSIINLNSAFDLIRQLTGGRLAGLPLKLIIRQKEVTAEGSKKIVHVLDIANETICLNDLLRQSIRTTAENLLPEFNLLERPDDLIPDAIIAPEGKQEKPEPIKPAEVEKPLTEAQIKRFYAILNGAVKEGLGQPLIDEIIAEAVPGVRFNDRGHIVFEFVTRGQYEQLCEMVEGWQCREAVKSFEDQDNKVGELPF